MTNKQLMKKVRKMYEEVNNLVTSESYTKDFDGSEVDCNLLDVKVGLALACNALYKLEKVKDAK